MKKQQLKNTFLNIVLPVGIALSIGVVSSALAYKSLMPATETKAYELPKVNVENTIEISQLKEIEGLSGVSNLFYFDGEDKITLGMNKDRQNALAKENKGMDYYREIYGGVYEASLLNSNDIKPVNHEQRQLNSLDTEFGAGYSPNGKTIDVVEDEISYLYDTKTGARHKYSDEDISGNWTKSGNGVVKFRPMNMEKETLDTFLVYDKEGKVLYEQALKDNVQFVHQAVEFYSEDGKKVSFVGRVLEGKTVNVGIYTMDMLTGELETVISMPHDEKKTIKNPGTDLVEHPGENIDIHLQSGIYQYDFLSNGKIIFEGMVANEHGLYSYDKTTDKLSLLQAYEGGLNFKIAPDESKIVYTIDTPIKDNTEYKDTMKGSDPSDIKPSKNRRNVYIANLAEDKLTNITYIKKNAFAKAFKWSNDSKQLIFLQPESATIGQVILK